MQSHGSGRLRGDPSQAPSPVRVSSRSPCGRWLVMKTPHPAPKGPNFSRRYGSRRSRGWVKGGVSPRPPGSSPPSGHCMSPSCAVSAELAASWRSRGLPGPPWAASSGSTLSSFWLPLASCYEVIHTASVWSLGRNCEHMPRRSIRWLFAGLGEELRTAAPLALAQSCRKAPRPSRVLTRDSLVSPTGSTEAESIMRWGEAILTCLCSWLFRLSFPKSMKTRQAAISLSQLWTLASIKFP